MEKVRNILKPKVDPQKQLREWQRRLRRECLNIDRQIRDIQREEKNVQKAIREAAKRNDMGSAKALAKEIIRSRRTVNRLYENKAQLNSISMHLGESVAIARTVGHLSKSAEVMKIVNNLMKAPEMAVTMQELSKEMTKAGVIEEIVNDAVDSALDSEDIEEETEEEIDKVLTAIAGETAAQLPEAVRKERLKQPAQSAEDAEVYRDDEWSFGYCEQGTGVFSCPSGKNPIYTYRECIVLGKTNFSIFIVNQILRELSREWPGHSYDLLSKNCNHFCDEFCERLGVPKLPGLGKCQRGCCCGCLNFDI